MPVGEGLYVHIPFCRRRCAYCALPSTGGDTGRLDAYLGALSLEAGRRLDGRRLFESAFVGGGTPSVLDAEQLGFLFDRVLARAKLPPGAEFSFECNPESIDRDKALLLRRKGVNRISLGVQSFDEAECLSLGRLHDPDRAIEAFTMLRDCGFDNVSIDLLVGFPGQRSEGFRHSLDQLRRLEPDHVSVYLFHVEAGTPMAEALRRGAVVECDEDFQVEMYGLAREVLAGEGYEHYEISNFARPGKRCLHNINYWRGGEYCGLGSGASSHENGRRFSNLFPPVEYIEAVGSGESAVAESERLEAGPKWRENLVLGLRLLEGVDLASLRPEVDDAQRLEALRVLDDCSSLGLVTEVDGCWRLSDRGLLLANEVMARLV